MDSDPKSLYKALVEHTLRSAGTSLTILRTTASWPRWSWRWIRSGNIADTRWLRGSGDARWDNSVKAVLAETKTVGKSAAERFPGEVHRPV